MSEELRKSLVIDGVRYALAVGQAGDGPPGEDTPGKVGVTYLDKEAKPPVLYACTAAVRDGERIRCSWVRVGGAGEGSGQNPDEIRAAVFEYMEQDATGAVVAVDAQEPTAEDNTTYIVMQSKTGAIFRFGIGDDGLPFVTNEAGATVWSGASGGTGGGDSSGGEDTGGGEDSGGDSSTEIPSDVVGDYRNTAITEIPDNAFKDNKNITGIDAPNATKVGKNAFDHCSALVEVNLPNAETFADFAFVWATVVKKLVFPKAKSLGTQAFSSCTALEIMDLGGVPTGGIRYQSVANTTALKALVLRCDSTVWPLNSFTFANNGITKGTGYVYVPAKLLDAYKTSDQWSTWAAQFRILEDYTVDGTIKGALDETKIGGMTNA